MNHNRSTEFGNILQSRVKEVNLQIKALTVLEGKENIVSSNCQKLSDVLHEARDEMTELGKMITEQKVQVCQMKELFADLEKLNNHISHIEKNIPTHYACNILESGSNEVNSSGDNTLDETPLPVSRVQETPVQRTAVVRMAPKSRLREQDIVCPTVPFLTQDEFENMPAYMRGSSNLKYDSVNAFIVCFNAALIKKYQILSHGATKIKDRQLYSRYKREETKETKGCFFITEEDVKNSNHGKTYKTLVTLLSILRCTQRIREIRGQGVVRYTVVV